MRCVFGVLSDVLLFVAFDFTSFSKAFALFFTSTLLAPFLGRAILGEPIKKWDIIAIVCGFCGMLLLVNPLKAESVDVGIDDSIIDGTTSKSRDLIGCGIGVLSAVNGALAIIYIRKLASQVHCSLQPMYYMLAMAVFCPIWSLILPVKEVEELTIYSWQMYLGVFGLATIAFF